MFFVAQGDGSHFFSKDFSSHAKAISRYRVIQKKFQQQQEMEMEMEKENETPQKEKE